LDSSTSKMSDTASDGSEFSDEDDNKHEFEAEEADVSMNDST